MSEIIIDESDRPLVTITYPEHYSDEEFVTCVARQVELIVAGPQVAFLVDPGPTVISAKHRRHLANEMDKVEQISRRHLVGVAMVARSALMRGAITAISWLKPAVFPFAVFATPEGARRWLETKVIEPTETTSM